MNQAVAQAQTSVGGALAPSRGESGAGNQTSAPGIAGSGLDGIFKRFPLAGGATREAFPRAAVTIVSATPSIFTSGRPSVEQCVRFNVRLWTSASASKSFAGLQMCGKDITPDVSFAFLRAWPAEYVVTGSTGEVRTDGPRRPKTNFPTDQRTAGAWFERPSVGVYFVGSILYQMGYDWDHPGESRLWFVSAPGP